MNPRDLRTPRSSDVGVCQTIRPLLFLIILIGLWFWYIMTKLSNDISAKEIIKARLGKEAK